MKQYKVAILGATGAVGCEMMKILAERDFPVAELHLLASERSVGQLLPWKGQDIAVELACDEAFKGMDIVLALRSGHRQGRCRVRGQLQRVPHGPRCAAGHS